LYVIGLLLMTHPLFAEEATEAVSTQAASETPSQDARQTRNYGVSGRLGGVARGLLGIGVEGYKMLDGNLQIGGTVMAGGGDVSGDVSNPAGHSSTSDTVKMWETIVAGQARWFFGNSFALGASVGYQDSTVEYGVGPSRPTSNVDGSINGRAVFIGGSIGNHWTYDNGFTIGCDWLGFMVPIAKKVSVGGRYYNSPSDKEDKAKNSKADNIEAWAKQKSIGGVNLFLMSIGKQF
ncbi:MAG: hypothetical protein WCO71_12650, partial [Pseudomonadota bacterium]